MVQEALYAEKCELEQLDLAGNPELSERYCEENRLTKLDVTIIDETIEE